MEFLETVFGTPLEKLKMKDIKTEEFRLLNRVELIRKDIQKYERKKIDLFKQGVGADLIKKKMISQEIKHQNMQAQMKIQQFMLIHKQYMFISNLVILKEYEKQFKTTPLWVKIKNIEPSQFENSLIHVTFKGKNFEEVLSSLNNVFEMGLTDSNIDESLNETDKQLMDAWNGVETGAIDVVDAQQMVSSEKHLEMKETERS